MAASGTPVPCCASADALVQVAEPKLLRAAGDLYDEPDLTLARLTHIADGWRPVRTWTSVLIRLGANRHRS